MERGGIGGALAAYAATFLSATALLYVTRRRWGVCCLPPLPEATATDVTSDVAGSGAARQGTTLRAASSLAWRRHVLASVAAILTYVVPDAVAQDLSGSIMAATVPFSPMVWCMCVAATAMMGAPFMARAGGLATMLPSLLLGAWALEVATSRGLLARFAVEDALPSDALRRALQDAIAPAWLAWALWCAVTPEKDRLVPPRAAQVLAPLLRVQRVCAGIALACALTVAAFAGAWSLAVAEGTAARAAARALAGMSLGSCTAVTVLVVMEGRGAAAWLRWALGGVAFVVVGFATADARFFDALAAAGSEQAGFSGFVVFASGTTVFQGLLLEDIHSVVFGVVDTSTTRDDAAAARAAVPTQSLSTLMPLVLFMHVAIVVASIILAEFQAIQGGQVLLVLSTVLLSTAGLLRVFSVSHQFGENVVLRDVRAKGVMAVIAGGPRGGDRGEAGAVRAWPWASVAAFVASWTGRQLLAVVSHALSLASLTTNLVHQQSSDTGVETPVLLTLGMLGAGAGLLASLWALAARHSHSSALRRLLPADDGYRLAVLLKSTVLAFKTTIISSLSRAPPTLPYWLMVVASFVASVVLSILLFARVHKLLKASRTLSAADWLAVHVRRPKLLLAAFVVAYTWSVLVAPTLVVGAARGLLTSDACTGVAIILVANKYLVNELSLFIRGRLRAVARMRGGSAGGTGSTGGDALLDKPQWRQSAPALGVTTSAIGVRSVVPVVVLALWTGVTWLVYVLAAWTNSNYGPLVPNSGLHCTCTAGVSAEQCALRCVSSGCVVVLDPFGGCLPRSDYAAAGDLLVVLVCGTFLVSLGHGSLLLATTRSTVPHEAPRERAGSDDSHGAAAPAVDRSDSVFSLQLQRDAAEAKDVAARR